MAVDGSQQFIFEVGGFITGIETHQAHLTPCNAVALIEFSHSQLCTGQGRRRPNTCGAILRHAQTNRDVLRIHRQRKRTVRLPCAHFFGVMHA